MKVSVFSGTQAHETQFASEVKETDLTFLQTITLGSPWAPGVFDANHRKIANLRTIEVLALDVDDGCTIAEATRLFAPYSGFIGTSKNHQKQKGDKPPCDRFRIVLQLGGQIKSDADYKATWLEAQKICPAIDASCKDSARFFFPCVAIVENLRGNPFPVVSAPPSTSEEFKPINSVSSNAKGELSYNTKQFLLHGPRNEAWHRLFFKAGKDIMEQGYDFEEAITLLTKASTYSPQYLDKTDLHQLEDIYKTPPKHPPRLKPPLPPAARNPTTPLVVTPNSNMLGYQRSEPSARIAEAKEDRLRKKIAAMNGAPFLCSAFDGILKLDMGLYLIGACTGKGKSTTAANLIAHFFLNCPSKEVIVISNEETSSDIYGRVACILRNINFQDYRASRITAEQEANIGSFIDVLAKRIEIVDTTKWDMTCLEDVQAVLEKAGQEQERVGLVVVDYLQTITHSKNDPHMDPLQISKSMGNYLMTYGQSVTIPIAVFAQLKPKADTEEFSSRFQNDRTILNHAVAAIEIVPDFKRKITDFIIHKDRHGDAQGRIVPTRWVGGRFEKIPYSVSLQSLMPKKA